MAKHTTGPWTKSSQSEGGRYITILPASAWYDSDELKRETDGTWFDLPTASFAETGTNIATGFMMCWAVDR